MNIPACMYDYTKRKTRKPCLRVSPKGSRCDWIRTSDLCVPNAALYQAEPRIDKLFFVAVFCLPQQQVRYYQTDGRVSSINLKLFSGGPGLISHGLYVWPPFPPQGPHS